MKRLIVLLFVLCFVGCMSSPFVKIGPQSVTRIGTFHYEAETVDDKAMSGTLSLDEIKALAEGDAQLNVNNLKYLKIKGNFFEDDGLGRDSSLLVVFDGKYLVDADNASEFFTDINIYKGNSWFGDLFNKGLAEDESSVPLVPSDTE